VGSTSESNDARAKQRLKQLELDDMDGALCRALLDVLDGTLEPGVATAAASVARTIHAVRSATEHEQRIRALEERLEATAKGWTA